ncbi:FeoA family protein [Falsibacillus albus]|uniref:Ferrous iron transport protein A n=1 Tax=Falsibacillus albus TaxID=2478915 RepID=A0A3L7K227_9BACI|nr:FeoA family protein [Falsibacillus albus]RLQ97147.1 ferrous iron transport protein A [Falsibacillus albus]
MNLTTLKKGQIGVIKDISNTTKILQDRLLHIGVCEGCPIKLERTLPFGGPCMIECGGQLIGIRRKDAEFIKVESDSCKQL